MTDIPISLLFPSAHDVPEGLTVYYKSSAPSRRGYGVTVSQEEARTFEQYGAVMDHWRTNINYQGKPELEPVWAIWNKKGQHHLDSQGKARKPEYTWMDPAGWTAFENVFLDDPNAGIRPCPECERDEAVFYGLDYLCKDCRDAQ